MRYFVPHGLTKSSPRDFLELNTASGLRFLFRALAILGYGCLPSFFANRSLPNPSSRLSRFVKRPKVCGNAESIRPEGASPLARRQAASVHPSTTGEGYCVQGDTRARRIVHPPCHEPRRGKAVDHRGRRQNRGRVFRYRNSGRVFRSKSTERRSPHHALEQGTIICVVGTLRRRQQRRPSIRSMR